MRISKLYLAAAREQISPSLVAPVFIGDLAAYRDFVKELFSVYLGNQECSAAESIFFVRSFNGN
jgi:hypothetical protein